MNTMVLKVMASDRVTFLYYGIYTNYEWLNRKPAWRLSKDGIIANWNNNLLYYIPNSFYCKNYYKVVNTWMLYDTIQVPDKTNQGGIGVTFNLRQDEEAYLKGTMFFKLSSNDYGSGLVSTVNSTYAHTYLAVTGLSIMSNGVGVAFSSTSGRDLSSSSALVTLS